MKPLLKIIVLAFVAFACVFLYRIYDDVKFTRSLKVKRAADLQIWTNGTFVPISKTDNLLPLLLGRIHQLNTNSMLNELMENELAQSMHHLLIAHSTGDFESFSRYRVPIQPEQNSWFDTERLKDMKQELPDEAACLKRLSQLEPKIPLATLSFSKEMDVVKAWWYLGAPRYTNGIGDRFICTADWTEFAPDKFQLHVEEKKHAPITPIFNVRTHFGPINVIMTVKPFAKFKPTPDDIIVQNEKVSMAFCYVPVKLRRSNLPACPIIVSLYWVPSEGKWVPWEMGVPINDTSIYYVF